MESESTAREINNPNKPKEIVDQESVQSPVRRRLITGFLKGGVLGVSGLALGQEVFSDEHSIVTDSGVFIPLYERHDVGIQPEDIPRDINFLAREGLSAKGIFEQRAVILLLRSMQYADKNVRVFPHTILTNLASRKAGILLPDIVVDDERLSIAVEHITGIALAMGSIMGMIADKSDRRRFLKKISLTVGMWAASPLSTIILHDVTLDQRSALARIVTRINGLQSDFHPEQATVFFRNLLMVDKLMTVGEGFKKETGKVPKIAFQVGSGHSGMEDFLKVPHDILRILILSFPQEYLKRIVELNGGSVENFCSTRLIILPQDFNRDSINDPDFKVETDKKITDERLKVGLDKKLAVGLL